MTLQIQLDEYKKRFKAGEVFPVSQAQMDAMDQATTELERSKQAEQTLKVGDVLPNFELPNDNGELVSSETLLKRGPLVVTFYRGAWCDYCNMDMQALEEAYPRIKELGGELVSISPVTMSNAFRAIRKNKLSFNVLSDANNQYAEKFNLKFDLPDYLIDVYKGFGLDFLALNGDESWTLPMPARYVVDQNGIIRYAEVNADYTKRPDPNEVVGILRSMKR